MEDQIKTLISEKNELNNLLIKSDCNVKALESRIRSLDRLLELANKRINDLETELNGIRSIHETIITNTDNETYQNLIINYEKVLSNMENSSKEYYNLSKELIKKLERSERLYSVAQKITKNITKSNKSLEKDNQRLYSELAKLSEVSMESINLDVI